MAQVNGGSAESGGARTYFVTVPADAAPGVAYLELHRAPHVGAACPVLVLPPERWALVSELLQLLRSCEAAAGAGAPLHGAPPLVGLALQHVQGWPLCALRLWEHCPCMLHGCRMQP